MALDKAIKSGKEHRKPYRGSKVIDYSCRNHGSCPYCERNRKHKFLDLKGEQMLDDFIMNPSYEELEDNYLTPEEIYAIINTESEEENGKY